MSGSILAAASRERRAAEFVRWFLDTEFYDCHRFGCSSDMWIDDPERADRVDAAAEFGADGSTHYEVIQDMRSTFKEWLRIEHSEYCAYSAVTLFEDAVNAYFDSLEEWHQANGTLHDEIG